MEKSAVNRASEILKNVWIRENKGLSELIKKLRDDEKQHVKALMKLVDKPFFRLDPIDFVPVFRGVEYLEDRYKWSSEFKDKKTRREKK